MYIYRKEEIKEIDRQAAAKGMDGFTLMESAGRGLFEAMIPLLDKNQEILILAGRGNNGGDGIVLARYLKLNGYKCDLVFPSGEPSSSEAEKHYTYYRNCGYESAERGTRYDVIVDAMYGAGARLPLPQSVQGIIDWANSQEALRIAVDIPSGVTADKGEAEKAFMADFTFCLHGYKPSAFLEGTTEFYGKMMVIEIGLPHTSRTRIWTKEDTEQTFLKRQAGGHKGTYGTGLLIAGTDEMPGSARLAAAGALRCGIGKLKVAAGRFVSGIISGALPEAMFIHDGLDMVSSGQIPDKLSAAAIGPGLPDTETVRRASEVLLSQKDLPLILDAGALIERTYPEREAPVIVTPHPGEFSRMTGQAVKDIQNNRFEAAGSYAAAHGIIVVLKGRNTVMAFPDGDILVNASGNGGLAKGGTGDTLTGMLLAFLSSYKDVKAAVANAVYFHGVSAERWAETGAQTAMLASDLSEGLIRVMKEFE